MKSIRQLLGLCDPNCRRLGLYYWLENRVPMQQMRKSKDVQTLMTTDQLAQIKARADKATKGPWNLYTMGGKLPALRELKNPDGEASSYVANIESATSQRKWVTKLDFGYGYNGAAHEADAQFIARSREDVPALIAEVERLRALLDGVVAGLKDEGLHKSAEVVAKYLE